jgi:hypothetical protein
MHNLQLNLKTFQLEYTFMKVEYFEFFMERKSFFKEEIKLFIYYIYKTKLNLRFFLALCFLKHITLIKD